MHNQGESQEPRRPFTRCGRIIPGRSRPRLEVASSCTSRQRRQSSSWQQVLYAAPAPVVEHIVPVPVASYVAPAPDVCSAPRQHQPISTWHQLEPFMLLHVYTAPAPVYFTPALAVIATPALVGEYIATTPARSYMASALAFTQRLHQ